MTVDSEGGDEDVTFDLWKEREPFLAIGKVLISIGKLLHKYFLRSEKKCMGLCMWG